MRGRPLLVPALLALALAACVLVPAAAAAPSYETEGRLQMPDGVTLRGGVDLEGAGLMELEGPAGTAGFAMDFTALSHGLLVDRTRDKVHVGLPGLYEPSVIPPAWANVSIAADGAGRIENVRCGTLCRIAVAAEPGEGLVGAQGTLDATFEPIPGERVFNSADSPQNYSSQWRYVVPAGSVQADSTQFADPEPRASGHVTLVIVDAAFDLVAGRTRTTWDARWSNETMQQAAGNPVTVRHHSRYAELPLDGAALGLAPGAPFRLSFPTGADALLDGEVSSEDASGLLIVAGKRHDLDHASVLLDGSFTTRLAGTQPGLLGGAPAVDAGLRGKATAAVVSGSSVTPSHLPAAATAAGGGLLAVAVLAVLGRFLALPLYHRLGPADLLANRNRRRIHEAIGKAPGVDVGALVSGLGMSRVLVRHHLRMLEAHGLVRATEWRRRRTYALIGAGLGLAACELKDATRRKVAAAVAQSGGATQKDLSAALGLSQRLVSYHLKCLGDSSLVRADGRSPRVYRATPTLAQALRQDAPAGDALGHALEKEGEGTAAAVATGA